MDIFVSWEIEEVNGIGGGFKKEKTMKISIFCKVFSFNTLSLRS